MENNGGKFARDISSDVTHLVCSTKAWKEYHSIGKFANLDSFTSTDRQCGGCRVRGRLNDAASLDLNVQP